MTDQTATLPSVSDYLKYANLQLAAEALLKDDQGVEHYSDADLIGALEAGNKHTSRFAQAQATQFANDWVVLDQASDDDGGKPTTGFSGTLFRNKATGELVISLRSTEFVDDAARDNEATNSLEIQKKGFAFGQIDDMENWFKSLQNKGLIPGDQQITVTGYSLGGHLAAAFNILHGADRVIEAGDATAQPLPLIKQVVTFNGAGVGQIAEGNTLGGIIQEFDAVRHGFASKISNQGLHDLYLRTVTAVAHGSTISDGDRAILDMMLHGTDGAPGLSGQDLQQAQWLSAALGNIADIRSQVDYLSGVTGDGQPANDSSTGAPKQVKNTAIAQEDLDYQMAVQEASTHTTAASIVAGGLQAVFGKSYATFPGTQPQYDVVGDTVPSAVSNSQWHIGIDVPVFIENQPLTRGGYAGGVAWASITTHSLQLLPDAYATRDFGDTHSIVLLVDSLKVQDTLAKLDPTLTTGRLDGLLNAASNTGTIGEHPGLDQGQAEGDDLEKLVTGIADVFGLTKAGASGWSKLNPSLSGGTWWIVKDDNGHTGRDTFYNDLSILTHSDAYSALTGEAHVDLSGKGAGGLARNNFSALASLITLSPVVITTTDPAAQAGLDAALHGNWGSVFGQWATDKNMSQADRDQGKETFTQRWLDDRSTLLQYLVQRNEDNNNGSASGDVLLFTGLQGKNSYWYDYVDADGAKQRLNVVDNGLTGAAGNDSRALISFGGDGNDFITGGKLADRIYGGAGEDKVTAGDGNDYVEGGAGGDSLYGEKGNDTLVGGADGDWLEGGEGNDLLEGGDGSDTYYFAKGSGSDIIIDSAGNDVISVEDIGHLGDLATKKLADGTWESTDHKVHFTLQAKDATHNDLQITIAGRSDVITVRNYDADKANLGIVLAADVTQPTETRDFTGDFTKETGSSTYLFTYNNYRSTGVAQPGAADAINGTSDGDHIKGLGGNDGLSGGDGDDFIEGGDGSDLILGGFGADTLNGGDGNDFIFGSAVGTIDTPARIDFEPPKTTGTELARGFSWVVAQDVDASGHAVLLVTGANVFPGVPAPVGEYVESTGNIIDGGKGNDVIFSGTGADIVHGGDDDDEITGMGSSDILFGDGGNDKLWGDGSADPDFADYLPEDQHGNDILSGGQGDDQVIGQGGDDTLYGGSGSDKLYGDESDLDRTPTSIAGNDYLDGGEDDDTLVGGARADTLFGGTGNDHLWGDAGRLATSDKGYLQPQDQGDDYLDGEDGDDYLQGEGGNDTLYGGIGADSLVGDSDQDHLAGSAQGKDYLDGEDGNDSLLGGGGDDTLYGGSGDDQLQGDDLVSNLDAAFHGNDYLDGEDGNDTLQGMGGSDTLYGGAGEDYLEGDAPDVATAFQGNDYLDGGDGNDILKGQGGNDTLVGGAGNDMLLGGDGDDLLIGGAGGDNLQGGAGNDTYEIAAGDERDAVYVDTITDTDGTNTLKLDGISLNNLLVQVNADHSLSVAWGPDQGVFLLDGINANIQGIQADDGTMTLDELVGSRLVTPVTGGAGGAGGHVRGGAGSDHLTISAGGAQVHGGHGADTISLDTGAGATVSMSAGDGVDTVYATQRNAAPAGQSAPQNVLALGAGLDPAQLKLYRMTGGQFVLSIDSQGDGVHFAPATDSGGAILPGWEPFDLVQFADGPTLTWQQIIDRGIGAIPNGTSGDDVLTLTPIADFVDGLQGNDYIDGEAGDDVLTASEGNDTLIGGLGNDYLYAGTGNDSLVGGEGDDYLVSGSSNGFDTLEGGEGNDRYTLAFGAYTNIGGVATDSSATSNDTYIVSASSNVGGNSPEWWTITDSGGSNDVLKFDTSVVTPATTTVRHTADGYTLTTWNLTVAIKNAVTPSGIASAGSIESVQFQNGTVWSADQLRALSLQTTAGDDNVFGFDSNDVIDGGAGGDRIDGQGGNDTLSGGAGYDILNGGAGDDVLTAGPDGADMIGGTGDDTYVLNAGDGSINLGLNGRASSYDAGHDVLQVAANPSQVTVTYNQSSDGSTDALTVRFNDGTAQATIHLSGSLPGVDDPVETIRFADGSSIDVGNFVEAALAKPTSGNDTLVYSSLDEVIDAGDGNDDIHGGGGNDTILGGAGADTLYGGLGDDVVSGGTGDDTVFVGGGANDVVLFNAGDGHDTLWADSTVPSGSGTLSLGAGLDAAHLKLSWTNVVYQSANDDNGAALFQRVDSATLRLAFGADIADLQMSNIGYLKDPIRTVQFQDSTTSSLQALVAQANTATNGNDLLVDILDTGALQGGDGNDTLYGLEGFNTLDGGAGDDTLFGGDDNDTFIGGAGNDTIATHGGLNTIVYAKGDGNDQVDLSGGGLATLQFATGITTDDISLSYTGLHLFVNVAGSGSINLGLIKQPGQLPQIAFANGTVWSGAQTMAKLLSGSPGNDQISGFDTGDAITGGAGNDTINGGLGSDWLDGGTGNDVINGVGNGNSGGYFDTDTLIGGAGDDNLQGGYGSNVFMFDPGFGHDTVSVPYGQLSSAVSTIVFGQGISPTDVQCSYGTANGQVVLTMKSTGDTVNVSLGANDTVRFADSTVWSSADVTSRLVNALTGGNDGYTGTAGSDVIDGLAGDDWIHAGAGDDTISGGPGYDYLWGEDGNDRFAFGTGDNSDNIDGGAGNDVVFLGTGLDAATTTVAYDPADADASSYTLYFNGGIQTLNLSYVESVVFANGPTWSAATIDAMARTLKGTAGDDVLNGTAGGDVLLGVAGNDKLNGLAGDDTLDGGTGIDTMSGGAGNDTYFVDNAGDIVTEASNQGTDTVMSGVTYTLTNYVETLKLTGTDAINATGNSSANTLVGNAAANVLSGGSGADTMSGGLGDDTYVVDNAGDTVIENAGEGTDLVKSSISYTLGANIENLTLTGSTGASAKGNALANALTGGSGADTLTGLDGNDTLDGGSGSDTMVGGLGDDTYVVNVSTDVVTENTGEGNDTVLSGVTYTLGANLENLTLTGSSAVNGTGNTLNNLLKGNTGANVLSGGGGADTMAGGAGDDTYVVDSADDVVVENLAEGTDLVQASTSYTLGANLENLTLTGTALAGTGNALANTLTGNASANTLDGGAGADTMVGGAGNDTYVVDNAGDVVTEASSAGTDLVQASVTYMLASNVENLTLTGSASINGTGNTLANVLRGNAGANTLDGGTGADTMIGGAGNDTYIVDSTSDVVTENASEGIDLVKSSVSLTLGSNVENLTLTGTSTTGTLTATGNALDNVLTGDVGKNQLTGGAGNDTLDGGLGNDTMLGGTGDDTYYVNVSTDVVTENAGEGTDTVMSGVAWTLGSNLENLTLTGGTAINGTGNTLNNVLTGNAAANTLTGAAGNDTLDGGAGNDTLVGGVGADTYRFGAGGGVDTIQENDSTAGVKDVIQFTGTVLQSNVQFKHVGNDLQALLNGTTDQLVVQNWYLGSQYHVEEFHFTDGSVLLDSQVQSLVSAMATFAAPAGATTEAVLDSRHVHNDMAAQSLAASLRA